MKVAFVGGTRFIGRAAAQWALAAGHDVVVLHRGVHGSAPPGAAVRIVDRSDAAALGRALAAERPDAVVDTRAMTRTDAEVAIEAMQGLGAAVVVLSSQDVYAQFGRLNGLPAPVPETVVTESSPLTIPYPFRGKGHPAGDDYDKKDVERTYLDAAGRVFPRVTVLRLPAVYGRGDAARRFGAIVDAIDAGTTALPCRGGASWRWTHAEVRDVAAAIGAALSSRERGSAVYDVAEQWTPAMRERTESIARAMGRKVTWVETEEVPAELAILGEMPCDFVVEGARIRRELGFREVTTEEQRVAELIAWLRESRVGIS